MDKHWTAITLGFIIFQKIVSFNQLITEITHHFARAAVQPRYSAGINFLSSWRKEEFQPTNETQTQQISLNHICILSRNILLQLNKYLQRSL